MLGVFVVAIVIGNGDNDDGNIAAVAFYFDKQINVYHKTVVAVHSF